MLLMQKMDSPHPSTLVGTPVAQARWTPPTFSFEPASEPIGRKQIFHALNWLTSNDCNLGRSIRPTMIEWGFGATLTSIVKPVMHALKYGYCLVTPPPMVKYNCSSFSTLFQPLTTPESVACDDKCDEDVESALQARHDRSGCSVYYSMPTEYNHMGFPVNFESTTVKKCNEKYSDALRGADALPDLVRGKLDYFETVAYIQARMLRPSDAMMADIERAKQAMGWPKPGTPVLSVHYRAGDSCLEEDVTLGRSCEPFSHHMTYVHQLAGLYGIKHIYLATDSPTAIEQTKTYANYTFLYSTAVSRGGVKSKVELDVALHEGLVDGCEEGKESLLDIHLLGQGDALVSKFSSNMARVAYGLMYARHNRHVPFISLDNAWCFDFGVASRVDATGRSDKKFFC